MLRRLYVKWLPIALGLTAAANLILTPFLPRGSQPILIHDEASLTYLAHNSQPSVDRRFSFYLELDDATDGGELVVPVDSFVSPELVEGFADMEVVERDYDPVGSLPEDLVEGQPQGEVETDDANSLYWILDGDSDRWWLAFTNDGVVVVPETVAPAPGGDS